MGQKLGRLAPLPTGVLLMLILAAPLPAWARAQRMPLPPPPPSAVAKPQPAPLPNPDIQRPIDPTAARSHFTITDFRATTIDNSAGFGPGGQYRSAEDQRALQTPGLALKVPLQ